MRIIVLGLLGVLVALPVSSQERSSDMGEETASVEGTKTSESGSVGRTVFTRGVEERKPVDEITSLSNDDRRIYYYSEIKGRNGEEVMHRWEYNDKVMAEVGFKIGSSFWRVWSSKNLLPSWLGEWRVSVVDETGRILRTDTFTYTEAGETE